MTVTFGCIGCGNMGGAILRGLAGKEGVALMGVDADPQKTGALANEIGMKVASNIHQLLEEADYVLLAVKPNQVRTLLNEQKARLRTSQVIISIAAGVTLEQLKDYSSGSCAVVRVMPNTPAMVQEGVFAICLEDPALKENHKQFVLDMFSTLGQAHDLPERSFDAFTAIAGSGPAYVFYFMEALVEAGVALGLYRDQATKMVEGLFTGSATLAAQSDKHLSLLREMVTSPGGTTIAATNVLDDKAVRGSIIQAAKAACQKCKELS